MPKFDAADVNDQNMNLFDHLPREYVLKRLLGVHSKAYHSKEGDQLLLQGK